MPTEATTFANQLRHATAAVRLRHQKLGVRKSLTAVQREQAADVFHADRDALSASKKLLNTRHAAYRLVTGIRRQATDYWKMHTVPYPEPGVRLIKRERIADFDTRMAGFVAELSQAVDELQAAYDEMREEARQRLGDLFNAFDYPDDLRSEFALSWEYPSVDPPEYLKAINPRLYEQEQQRIAQRFDEAIRLAEQAFIGELHELVGHLAERLTGQTDGKPKVFRDTAVENLTQFFERFRALNIRSNAELDGLVDAAQAAISGKTAEALRTDGSVRAVVGEQLAAVRQQLDALIVDQPRRLIDFEDEVAAELPAAEIKGGAV